LEIEGAGRWEIRFITGSPLPVGPFGTGSGPVERGGFTLRVGPVAPAKRLGEAHVLACNALAVDSRTLLGLVVLESKCML
jgi:hypothetical protein